MFFFRKNRQINVQKTAVSVIDIGDEDYISLTDMIKNREGDFFVKDWLRNRNSLDFLAVWEHLHNPDFKGDVFAHITAQAGLNSFHISVKNLVRQTGAKGIIARTGRYGGTYAHKDIAFEFGAWINPLFKLYLIKEYRRLKEMETSSSNNEWNMDQIFNKADDHIHTDTVKKLLVPISTEWSDELEHADEADILNVIIFGCTSGSWRNQNPDRAKSGENIRDSASMKELVVLSALETQNARMIRSGIDKKTRFESLRKKARHELTVLDAMDILKTLKKVT